MPRIVLIASLLFVFVTQASADHHESDAARFEQLDSVKAFDEFQAKPPRGVSS